jgi:hypothetical protein
MMHMRMSRERAAIVCMMLFRTVDMQRAGAADRARQCGRPDRLIDDLADGAGTAAALGAAAEASVDMAGGTTVRGARGIAHLVVGQHIAGADDHPAIELIAGPYGVNENRSLQSF